jgi:dihydroxy-acid dehydratase
VPLRLDEFDELARPVPTLVNLMPSGKFLMEDFCYAGGVPAVMAELGDLLHTDHVSVTGRTLAENIADAQCWNREVIRTVAEPLQPPGSGTAVLRGNLCPGGAVIKQSAASPHLLTHRGRALVFDSIEEYHQAAVRPDLEVDESTVLVVRGAGPRGYPGMPEVGNFVLPRILLERGVTDMVRISDARMSGTGYGTVVLHVAPEATVGGPLALVRTGDWISLDVPARRLTMEVSDEELASRRAEWTRPQSQFQRGYARLYTEHVLQADQGADLDFLVGSSGCAVPRDNH